MRLRDYWSIFNKRWWIILLVTAAAVAATVGFSKLQTPIYRSTVKMTVSPSRLDYGLTLVIENLLRQYSQRLQTNKLAETVDERLQLDLPVDKLREKVKASPVPEDYTLVVTVDDVEANRAQAIAFAWADEFVKAQQILMQPIDPQNRIDVALLDRPTPGVLFYPQTRQYALAAAVLGLVVGALLAFGLEFLDDTLKSAEDVERFTGLPVVGMIPTVGTAELATPEGRTKVSAT